MNIKIVTDSTCDIPSEFVDKLGISVVPLYVTLNGRSYLDMKELSRDSFYAALPTAHPHPTTAAPSPGQFMQVYDQLVDKGAEAIFSIHISETLSAVFTSAQTANAQYKRVPVYAIDSGNLSMALGLIVLAAAEEAMRSGSVEAVYEALQRAIPRTHAYAKLDTIDYLLKGGRITHIQHNIIGLLGIKPILKMNNHVSRMEIPRTKSKGFERVVRVAKENLPKAVKFGITHANARSQVEKLLEILRAEFPGLAEPLINEVNPALGAHVGPGALCFNWISGD